MSRQLYPVRVTSLATGTFLFLAVLVALICANFEHQRGVGFSNSFVGTFSYTTGWPKTHGSFSTNEFYSTAPGATGVTAVGIEVTDRRSDLLAASINIATGLIILMSILYCVHEWHATGASLPFSTLHWWFFAMTTMGILCHSFVDIYDMSILISDMEDEDYAIYDLLMEKNWLVDIPIAYGLTCVIFATIYSARNVATSFSKAISKSPAR